MSDEDLTATLDALSSAVYKQAGQMEDRVATVLDIVGRQSRADHITVFGLDIDRGLLYQRFRWSKSRSPATPLPVAYPVSYFGAIDDLIEQHTHRIDTIDRIDHAPPATRALFENQHLTALACIPLADDLGPGGLVVASWTAPEVDPETAARLIKLVNRFLASGLAHASDLEAHRMKELALDSTSDVVCVAGIDGRLVYLNAAGRRLVGLPDDRPLTTGIWDYIEPHEARRIQLASFRSLSTRSSFTGELAVQAADGSRRPMEMMARVHRDVAGRARYVSAILRDVSERRAAEDRLREMINEKDRFVATVSHELRTPLTAVLGIVAELVEAPDAFDRDETRELLSLVNSQANEMADIVSDLLVVARLENDRVAIKRQPLSLADEVGGVVSVLGMDVTVAGEASAMADPGRVRQIVRNLLTNARRYGGFQVRIDVITDPRGRAVVRVRDDGPGIPAAAAERIFAPYERVVRAGGDSGIGLGLFVSRSLARLMDGDLTYARSGRDTVFELSLPGVESQIELVHLPLASTE